MKDPTIAVFPVELRYVSYRCDNIDMRQGCCSNSCPILYHLEDCSNDVMIQSFLAQMFQEKRLQHLIDDMSYNLQHLYCSWQTYYLSANILYHVHLYQLNLRRYYWHDILYNIMSCVHS